MRVRHNLFFCYLLFTLTFCNGQIRSEDDTFNQKKFILYSTENGLNSNLINSLAQDDKGFIWVGTDAGLYRFDGGTFQPFQNFGNKEPLAGQRILWLRNMGKNRLLISTRNGIQLLNTNNYEIKNYTEPHTSIISRLRNQAADAVFLCDKTIIMVGCGIRIK